MGLLDDAIREHLELKRRRGADTAEVARQEQEAFGPPRRAEAEAATATAQAVQEHEHDHAGNGNDFEAEAAPTALHAVEDAPQLQHEPPRPHGDPADDLPHAAPVADERESVVEEHPVAEHRVVPDPGQPTQAFDAHEVRAATGAEPLKPDPGPEPEPAAEHVQAPPPVREPEPEPLEEPAPTPAPRAADDEEEADEDADVLEETPEFLQETPEHDRLWFEQRPPRDFDF
jgi:hypothetical protein